MKRSRFMEAVHRKKPGLEISHVVLQSCCFRHGVRSVACFPEQADRSRRPLMTEPFGWEALRSRRSCAAQHSDPSEVGSADKPDPRRRSKIRRFEQSVVNSLEQQRSAYSRKRPFMPARMARIGVRSFAARLFDVLVAGPF